MNAVPLEMFPPTLKKVPLSFIKQILRLFDELLFPMTKDEIFGWPLLYKSHHIPFRELEAMRSEKDDLGDAAFDALSTLAGGSHDPDVLATTFASMLRDESEKDLPDELRALKDNMTPPAWLDWNAIEKGQLLFLKHTGSSAFGLLYFSLIGGFSAPKIVKTLDETGYLTSGTRDATWRRLNETFSMVVACMDSPASLQPGQDAWLSILRVRLLHSRTRLRILRSKKGWDTKEFGVPINQEDMMGTLLSFSANVLESIDRIATFGVREWMPTWVTRLAHSTGLPSVSPVSHDEQMAYLHLWRYIGHLVGVRPEFNKCIDVPTAKGATESVVMHLLHPNDRSRAVAHNVLSAVALREPLRWPMEKHAQAARMLLGSPLADALGLPFSWYHSLRLATVFTTMAAVSWLLAPFMTPKSDYIVKCKRALKVTVRDALTGTLDGADKGQFSGSVASTGGCPMGW